MAERTLTLSSAGKSYSFTGWKVGWATGPAELVAAVLAAKQWLTFTSGAPLQPAVATALDEHPDFPRALAAELQVKRDLLCAGLEKVGLAGRPPEGTYFATTDISGLGWPDAMSFCLALPERAGVVAIPTQVFYDDAEAGRQLVRWAFCKERDVIEEGLARLAGRPTWRTAEPIVSVARAPGEPVVGATGEQQDHRRQAGQQRDGTDHRLDSAQAQQPRHDRRDDQRDPRRVGAAHREHREHTGDHAPRPPPRTARPDHPEGALGVEVAGGTALLGQLLVELAQTSSLATSRRRVRRA